MFETCKIVTTWHCNLDCSYCCNKDLKIRETFKPILQKDLCELPYDDFEITGGEPLLPDRFAQTLCVLDELPKNRNVYLYTNGMYLNDIRLVKILKQHGVKGINIGYHHRPLSWSGLVAGMKILPMRLWVRNGEFLPFMADLGFEKIIRWEIGDCYKITTDRFFIK